MAIAFARLEFVKRSDGKTAVGKSAYNGRDRLIFEGNCVIDPRIYDYTRKEEPTYHTILIPEGVDKNYLIPEVLWNAVEKKKNEVMHKFPWISS